MIISSIDTISTSYNILVIYLLIGAVQVCAAKYRRSLIQR